MARKPRIWFPGATDHSMARGNQKMAIFTVILSPEMVWNCMDPFWAVDFHEDVKNVKGHESGKLSIGHL